MGKERTDLTSGEEVELLRHDGQGCLTHMWFGGDFPGYNQTRIRVYVDGEKTASIDMELGLGHGIGFDDPSAPRGTGRMGRTGYPSGLYNTHHIPFGSRIRVTAQLGEGVKTDAPFWWILRGVENLPVTLGGIRLPDEARLHLVRLENKAAKPLEEFDLCALRGAGAVYLVTMAARGEQKSGDWKDLSFMEGCVRAYLDGSSKPLMLSSGLEDYFLGTYYFNRGKYDNDLAGLTHLDAGENRFSAYRFHEADPLFFRAGLRLTARCGEEIDGKVFHDPPPTTYTTYVWVYRW